LPYLDFRPEPPDREREWWRNGIMPNLLVFKPGRPGRSDIEEDGLAMEPLDLACFAWLALPTSMNYTR